MEWITVSDELPLVGQDVLIWDGNCIQIGTYEWYDPGYSWWTDEGKTVGISHWMPLPPAPITLPGPVTQ